MAFSGGEGGLQVETDFAGDRPPGAEAADVRAPDPAVGQGDQGPVHMLNPGAHQGERDNPSVDIVSDIDIVALLERRIHLKHDPGEEVLERFLGGKTDDRREDGRGGDQAHHIDAGLLLENHHGEPPGDEQHRQILEDLRGARPPGQKAG